MTRMEDGGQKSKTREESYEGIISNLTSLQKSEKFVAHEIVRFSAVHRMRHQFDAAGLRQRRHPGEFVLLKALGQVEEVVRNPESSGHPTINHLSVGSIKEAFLIRPKR